MPASKELQANASSSSSRGDDVVVAVSNVAVRFAPPEELITHIPTISIDDMSDDEHRATYDTDEDGTNRQQSLVECIAAMRTLSLTETELEEQHNHTYVRTSPLRRLSSVSSFEAPMMLRRGSNRSVASESSSSTTSSKSTVASVLNDSERMREVRSHP